MDGANVSLQLRREVRPLKIGLQVNVSDAADLRRAFEIATAQWGGMLFPLIPDFRRRPPWWRHLISPGPSADEIRRCFRQVFDPDFVVLVGRASRPHSYGDVSIHTLTTAYGEGLQAGVSLNAVIREIWERHPRFLERNHATAAAPTAPVGLESWDLFVGACFGAFAEAGDLAGATMPFKTLLNGQSLPLTPELLLDGFPSVSRESYVSPLDVGMHSIEVIPRWAISPILMVLDPCRSSDLADFWNMRATGNDVIPIPLPWAEELAGLLAERLPRAGEDAGTPRRAMVTRAQRVETERLSAFADQLTRAGEVEVWRSSSEATALLDSAEELCWVVAADDRIEATLRDGTIRVRLPAPTPVAHSGSSALHGWVNVVTPESWTLPGDGSVAGWLPSELEHQFRPQLHLNARGGSDGVIVTSGDCTDFIWKPPSGTAVLMSVLRCSGTARLSQPGQIAKEVITRLGGLQGVRRIQHELLLRLLDDVARSQVELPEEQPQQRRRYAAEIPQKKITATLSRIHGSDRASAGDHLRALVDSGVLTSGLRLACPSCTHRGWYGVEAIGEWLTCSGCLREFPFPHAAPPASDDWAYRTLGAFTFRDYAAGAYTVVFALRFLLLGTRDAASWTTNLQLDAESEVDFAVVSQSRSAFHRGVQPQLLIGEAKSYGRFGSRDFERAKRLRKRYPSAILAFATLRSRLEPDEICQMRKLTSAYGRGTDSANARVLILTARELFDAGSPEECWQRDRETNRILRRTKGSIGEAELVRWSAITTELYLGDNAPVA